MNPPVISPAMAMLLDLNAAAQALQRAHFIAVDSGRADLAAAIRCAVVEVTTAVGKLVVGESHGHLRSVP